MNGRALPEVDYRVVEEIASSSRMAGEQGTGFMQQYGGPSGFQALDKVGIGDVYNAIAQGIPSEQLPVVTGLSDSAINTHLSTLEKMGLIRRVEVLAE